MKNTEIKGLTLEEIKQKIGSEEENLRKLKFAHQVSAIENPMKIQHTRKLVARLRTELTARENKK
ncbi:MAG: 50S ribosomal protein L29 [Cyclobacteriaceae bacterium]|nr:50S ribosomal protein L29 [Cyclobacteriaceae bacterium]